MNQLFNLAALAKEENDWGPVEQFLNRWEDILTDRLDLPIAFDSAPWAPFPKSTV